MYIEERVSIERILLIRPPQYQGAKPYKALWTPIEEIRNRSGRCYRSVFLKKYITTYTKPILIIFIVLENIKEAL